MNFRPAAVITLVYLGLTLPLAVMGCEGDAPSTLFLLAHLSLLAVMAAAARIEGGSWGRTLLDWAPMLAIPLLYAELPQLMRGAGAEYQDVLVQRWEASIFGTSPAISMARSFPTRWVSEPLHLAYLSYYAIIYVPAAVLWSQDRRSEFLVMSATVLLAFVGCFAVFVLFPVQGPRYLWDPVHVPGGPVRSVVVALLEQGSSRGAAFPSSHVAVAVVQAVLAHRYRLSGGWAVSVLTVGLAAGAVYGGFHYAVDVIAGLGAGLATVSVAPHLASRVSSERLRDSALQLQQ